jgi:hypothetical protein
LPNANIAERLRDAFHQLGALVRAEQRLFVNIRPNANDQLIHESAAALDHVQVAKRDGVERTGINSTARHIGLRIADCGLCISIRNPK